MAGGRGNRWTTFGWQDRENSMTALVLSEALVPAINASGSKGASRQC